MKEIRVIVTAKSITVRTQSNRTMKTVVEIFRNILTNSDEISVVPYENGADICYYGRKNRCFDLMVALTHSFKVDLV